MTREQALEEAAERAARLLLDAETICHAVSNRGGPTYPNMAEAFKQGRDQCKAALAFTRQEPAPAAEVEEVAGWRNIATAPEDRWILNY